MFIYKGLYSLKLAMVFLCNQPYNQIQKFRMYSCFWINGFGCCLYLVEKAF